jgi:hypothetical protein
MTRGYWASVRSLALRIAMVALVLRINTIMKTFVNVWGGRLSFSPPPHDVTKKFDANDTESFHAVWLCVNHFQSLCYDADFTCPTLHCVVCPYSSHKQFAVTRDYCSRCGNGIEFPSSQQIFQRFHFYFTSATCFGHSTMLKREIRNTIRIEPSLTTDLLLLDQLSYLLSK